MEHICVNMENLKNTQSKNTEVKKCSWRKFGVHEIGLVSLEGCESNQERQLCQYLTEGREDTVWKSWRPSQRESMPARKPSEADKYKTPLLRGTDLLPVVKFHPRARRPLT